MVVGIGVPPIGMSPHLLEDAMENQSSYASSLVTGQSFISFIGCYYTVASFPSRTSSAQN